MGCLGRPDVGHIFEDRRFTTADLCYITGASQQTGRTSGDGKMADAGTLTRADLAEVLNRQVGLSRTDAAAMIESILGHMTTALLDGENVKISGFGTFVLRDKSERIGRNPKTGIEVPITPRRVLTFRASQGMRQKVK